MGAPQVGEAIRVWGVTMVHHGKLPLWWQTTRVQHVQRFVVDVCDDDATVIHYHLPPFTVRGKLSCVPPRHTTNVYQRVNATRRFLQRRVVMHH